jgi:hypothetical protein
MTCQRHCDAGNKLLEVFNCRSEYHGVDMENGGAHREREGEKWMKQGSWKSLELHKGTRQTQTQLSPIK